jgi:hypothetical protein
LIALTHLRFGWLRLTVHRSQRQFSQLLVDGPNITVLSSKVSVFDLEQSLDLLSNLLGLASKSEENKQWKDQEQEQMLDSLSSSVVLATSWAERSADGWLRSSTFSGLGTLLLLRKFVLSDTWSLGFRSSRMLASDILRRDRTVLAVRTMLLEVWSGRTLMVWLSWSLSWTIGSICRSWAWEDWTCSVLNDGWGFWILDVFWD